MRTSPYVREVELAGPNAGTTVGGDGATHICYNTLTGSVLAAPRAFAELLARGREEPLSPEDIESVGDGAAESLLAERWLYEGEPDAGDAVAVREGVFAAASQLGQYGVVPWPADEAPFGAPHAVEVVSALAEAERKPNRHYHLYALTEPEVTRLPELAGLIEGHWSALPAAADGERLLILTVNPTADIDWGRWSFLSPGEGRLRVPIHAPMAGEDADLPQWIETLAETVSGAAQVGFAGWVIIYVTGDDPPGWPDTAMELLSGTGILDTCARPFCYVAKRDVPDWREHLCELDNIDFDLLERVLREGGRRRRGSLLYAHGGGLVHKASALVTRREPLTPDVLYCNSTATGYYVNLAGEVWPCPKMAAGLGREAGARPPAIYNEDGMEPDLDEARRWRMREVTAIEGCRGCVGTFTCAGGCALEAAREHDGDPYHPACQPVERYMQTVIHSQQRRLTRRFGPRQTTAP